MDCFLHLSDELLTYYSKMAENHVQDREQLAAHLTELFAYTQKPDFDDRLIAISCCAYLETVLEEAIVVRLPGLSAGLRASMFAPGRGAAGSLGAKIDFAEAVRAVGPDAAKDLRIMAKIRNKFAHRLDAPTFDAEQVRDLVLNLKRLDEVDLPEPIGVGPGGLRHSFMKWEDRSLRGRFVYSASVLMGSIFNASIDAGFGLACAE